VLIIYPIRINKYLRDSGLASRREADKLVESGFVLVNGNVVENGFMVNKGDKIVLKNKNKEYKYFAYYKPRGLSTQDLPGKKSVITEWKSRGLYPIGRLDKESEGLLILTNDGRFVREVLSRKNEYEKEYLVTTRETLRLGIVEIMGKGMITESLGKLLPVKAEIVNKKTIKMILNEGKKHQIRIMLNDFSYNIVSLKRIRIGNIKIGNLKPGEIKSLKINL
jgi:23S rRNA pseudouridine2604 synthase